MSLTYFAQSFPAVAGTFTGNAHLFGKIDFPRLTVPMSVIVGNLAALGLQLVTFAAAWVYFRMFTPFGEHALLAPLPALGLLLIPPLGMLGAALAAACATLCWKTAALLFVRRQLGINPTLLPLPNHEPAQLLHPRRA